MRAVRRARQGLTRTPHEISLHRASASAGAEGDLVAASAVRRLDRAAALLAFGARAAIVAITAAFAPFATETPATATTAAAALAAEIAIAARFAALSVFAGLGLRITRAAMVVPLAAVTTAAAAAMAVVALVAVAAGLTITATRSGCSVLGLAAAEEAFQPAEEAAGFFLRHRLRRAIIAARFAWFKGA